MICGVEIPNIVQSLALHFLLSGFVGLLVYLLTSIILSAIFSGWMDEPTIHRYSISLALCCAVLAHILEDFLFGWF